MKKIIPSMDDLVMGRADFLLGFRSLVQELANDSIQNNNRMTHCFYSLIYDTILWTGFAEIMTNDAQYEYVENLSEITSQHISEITAEEVAQVKAKFEELEFHTSPRGREVLEQF